MTRTAMVVMVVMTMWQQLTNLGLEIAGAMVIGTGTHHIPPEQQHPTSRAGNHAVAPLAEYYQAVLVRKEHRERKEKDQPTPFPCNS